MNVERFIADIMQSRREQGFTVRFTMPDYPESREFGFRSAAERSDFIRRLELNGGTVVENT